MSLIGEREHCMADRAQLAFSSTEMFFLGMLFKFYLASFLTPYTIGDTGLARLQGRKKPPSKSQNNLGFLLPQLWG